ncbi:hypothetical protein BMS3Abin03_03080 [bacterium BMS3Abin03]|nr:hypothetical protein BMS3Abin03_03080 [bacterium BMS3Abin03]
MQTFTYSIFYKLIFRFGNLIVTFLLVIYLVPIIVYIDKNKILLIPLVISLIILYIVNRTYLIYHKILPYKIEADEDKMKCTKFFLSKKEIVIYYKDIESLSGGIFSGKLSGILKVCDGKNQVCIGFSQKMKDSGKLITFILSKVNKELYDQVINHLTAKKKR